jgi:hypothetical protein
VFQLGREELLIYQILTTALEKLLTKIGGEPKIQIIHPPLPGNFPLADVHRISGN